MPVKVDFKKNTNFSFNSKLIDLNRNLFILPVSQRMPVFYLTQEGGVTMARTPEIPGRTLDWREAAEYLGCTEGTLRVWCSKRKVLFFARLVGWCDSG